ncbi:hypothetical protein [Streptomyces dangxiongensis]|uniref:hypothetical protein n=1 Tax=Streptomyces dangxiongensis TaxID=1442032 RepID=UPI001969D4D3|nr:hypothetical protein [Streptomyces dangxiongensis]
MRPPPPCGGSTPPPTTALGIDAANAGVLTEDQTRAGHSLVPEHVRRRIRRNREQLAREWLDLVLPHNPERAHPATVLPCTVRSGTLVEEEVGAGRVPFTAVARSRTKPTWSCGGWPPRRCTAASSLARPARSPPTSSGRA